MLVRFLLVASLVVGCLGLGKPCCPPAKDYCKYNIIVNSWTKCYVCPSGPSELCGGKYGKFGICANNLVCSVNKVWPFGRCYDPNNVCGQDPDPGPCKGSIRRYYYDSKTNTCRIFYYGGCYGNQNTFKTYNSCFKSCGVKDICTLPPETGPCKAYFIRWYYDPKTKSCRKFVYGGCLGNQNNFLNYWDCARKCRKPNIWG